MKLTLPSAKSGACFLYCEIYPAMRLECFSLGYMCHWSQGYSFWLFTATPTSSISRVWRSTLSLWFMQSYMLTWSTIHFINFKVPPALV